MDRNQIEERIAKKQAQIDKLNKKIEKKKAACSPEELEIANKYADSIWVEFVRACEAAGIGKYGPAEELRSALIDLREAEATMVKYKNQLNAAIAKEDKLSQEKIKVIWDYLLHYKEMSKDYIHKNLEVLKDYYKANHEYCEYVNNNGWKVRRGELKKEDYLKKEKELDKAQKKLKNAIDPLTMHTHKVEYVDGERVDVIDDVELEKILDSEIDNLYLRMIEQVTDKIGEITDASNLSIGAKGELNGFITGEKGTVKIETIGAGGYNIQRFHFRTLVHKVA